MSSRVVLHDLPGSIFHFSDVTAGMETRLH